MFTIKVVSRVRPCEPEQPEDAPADWVPRRWAGSPVEWHGDFVSIMDLGGFTIQDDEEPWQAARAAFDWRPEHGFDRVHVGDFNPDDRHGYCIIGHKQAKSEVFINPADSDLYILGPDGKTIDRPM
jgi:hypothetical protein